MWMKKAIQGAPTVRILRFINLVLPLLFVLSGAVCAKPGAAISLRGPTSYQLQAFTNSHLNLEFSLPARATRLVVQMQVQGSIVVLSPEPDFTIDLADNQTLFTLPLEIATQDTSTNYLMFNLILSYENGLTEARSLGIRLQVGEDTSSTENSQKPASEEKMKLLPATETVISD